MFLLFVPFKVIYCDIPIFYVLEDISSAENDFFQELKIILGNFDTYFEFRKLNKGSSLSSFEKEQIKFLLNQLLTFVYEWEVEEILLEYPNFSIKEKKKLELVLHTVLLLNQENVLRFESREDLLLLQSLFKGISSNWRHPY